MKKLLFLLCLLLSFVPILASAASSGGNYTMYGETVIPVADQSGTGGNYSGSGAINFTVGASIGGPYVASVGTPLIPSGSSSSTPTTPTTSSAGGVVVMTNSQTATTPGTPPGTATPFIYNVQVAFVSQTNAYITYDSSDLAQTHISYTDQKTTLQTQPMGNKYTHREELHNLTPNTKYTFVIYADFVSGEHFVYAHPTYTFTTLPLPVPQKPLTTASQPKTTIPKTPTTNTTPQTPVTPTPAVSEDSELPPPTDFTYALQDDSSLVLTWKNPADPRVDKVVLVKNYDHFPRTPKDGTIIFRGFAEAAPDVSTLDKNAHYTIFAADKNDKLSIGVPLKAIPVEKIEKERLYNTPSATPSEPTMSGTDCYPTWPWFWLIIFTLLWLLIRIVLKKWVYKLDKEDEHKQFPTQTKMPPLQ